MRKKRGLGILGLALVLSAPLPAEAGWFKRCRDALRRFNETPSNIRWTKRLPDHCPVSNQVVANCWMYPYQELYTRYARQKGVFDETEVLNVDYYAARMIEEKARAGDPAPLDLADDSGKLDALIREYGFVSSGHYAFPKESFTAWDNGAQSIFQKRLRKAGDDEEKSKILLHFLGDLDRVQSRRVPLAEGESYFTFQYWSATDPSHADKASRIAALLERIQAAIDQGTWVSLILPMGGPSGAPQLHAMQISGYRLGEDGKIDLLLVKNSHGYEYGFGGYSFLRRPFFDEHVTAIEVPVSASGRGINQ